MGMPPAGLLKCRDVIGFGKNTIYSFLEVKPGFFYYTSLSTNSWNAWANILRAKKYDKGDYFISVGQVPRNVAFVSDGLFSQYYLTEQGNKVIKYFFPEGRIAGSVPAAITGTASPFVIKAIEQTRVLEYDFRNFKKLVSSYKDIAEFYINYMEKHWIIEKEPQEISYRHDTADVRYNTFLEKNPKIGQIG